MLKTTTEHTRAIDLNIDASLDFLSRVLSLKDMPFHRLKREKNLLDLPCIDGMLTEHEPAKRWMAVRLRIEHETWKHVKGVTRNRYWKKMIAAGQEEVCPRQAVRPKRWNNTNMIMHAGTGGSSTDRLVGNVEQDQNGHAFQTSADISAGAHDDWMTQEKLQHEFDGAMRFP